MDNTSFSRRRFLTASTGFAAVALAANGAMDANHCFAEGANSPNGDAFPETTFSLDSRQVKFYSKAVDKPVKILHISDSHLYMDDERGDGAAGAGGVLGRERHVDARLPAAAGHADCAVREDARARAAVV